MTRLSPVLLSWQNWTWLSPGLWWVQMPSEFTLDNGIITAAETGGCLRHHIMPISCAAWFTNGGKNILKPSSVSRCLQTVWMPSSEDCFWYHDRTRDISACAHYTECPGLFTSVTLTVKGNIHTPDNMATLRGADWKEMAFSQWFCWRLNSSGMWCCVTGWVVLFISANYSAWNFRVRHCDYMEHWALLTLHHSITSKKAWIFRSRFVEYGSEINWAYLLTSSCLFCHRPRCLLLCAHNALMWLTADVYWYVHIMH
jgi:hypothetical protein